MNLPNLLTFSRFVMAAVVFWLIAVGDREQLCVALIIFVIACITDFFDGYFARRRNEETAFGRIADPFADKFMVTGCLLFLLERNVREGFVDSLGPFIVFLILAREFLVNAIRGYSESQSIAFPAVYLGKFKAVWQFCAIGLLILYRAYGGELQEDLWSPYHKNLPILADFVVYSTAFVTVVSAVPYVLRAKKLFQ